MKRRLVLHDGSHGKVASQVGKVVVHLSAVPADCDIEWHSISVLVRDVASLQGLTARLRSCGRTRRFQVSLKSQAPSTLLHCPAGLVDGRNVLEASFLLGEESTLLNVRLAWQAPGWAILASCTAGSVHQHTWGISGLRLGASSGDAGTWLGLARHADVLERLDAAPADPNNPGPVPKLDVLIGSGADADLSREVVRPRQSDGEERVGGLRDGDGHLPLPECRIFNPIGWNPRPQGGLAYTGAAPQGGISIEDASGVRLDHPFRSLGERTVGKLRPYSALVDRGSAHRDLVSRADFLMRALSSGIRVVAPDRRELVGCLPENLLSYIEEDYVEIDSEEGSRRLIGQVRESHRCLTARGEAFRSLRTGNMSEESVSVVLATKRPDFVEHALRNFMAQTWPNKELVLGLHGFAMSDLASSTAAEASRLGQVREFNEDVVFGEMLQELSAIADGVIIAKMDDDDWYAPPHLEDLVYALRFSGAQLVGSPVQFVYLHSADMTVQRGEEFMYKYGGHPGGPTFMLPKAVLAEAGGWPLTRRAVDTGLNQKVVEVGGSVFQSHGRNFLFNKRSSGHTWKASTEYFLRSARRMSPGLYFPIGFGGLYHREEEMTSMATRLPGGRGGLVKTEVMPRASAPDVSSLYRQRIG